MIKTQGTFLVVASLTRSLAKRLPPCSEPLREPGVDTVGDGSPEPFLPNIPPNRLPPCSDAAREDGSEDPGILVFQSHRKELLRGILPPLGVSFGDVRRDAGL